MTQRNDDSAIAKKQRERRDYFRISDRIGLEVHKLPTNTHDDFSVFGNTPLTNLQAEFKRLDQDIKTQLAGLSERDRALQSLLKVFNSKLDILARIMAFEQNPLQPEHWHQATLSEGGVAFVSSEDNLQVGDHIAIRLTLPPELLQPRAVGEVVGVNTEDRGGKRIHTRFVRLEDSDRQQLARHIMRWQIRQRQQPDDGTAHINGQSAD
ncbi:MAG: PilZ domain-containing protein [Marinobacter sp.]